MALLLIMDQLRAGDDFRTLFASINDGLGFSPKDHKIIVSSSTSRTSTEVFYEQIFVAEDAMKYWNVYLGPSAKESAKSVQMVVFQCVLSSDSLDHDVVLSSSVDGDTFFWYVQASAAQQTRQIRGRREGLAHYLLKKLKEEAYRLPTF